MKVLFHGSGQYPDGTPIGPRCWPHHDLIVVLKGRIVLQFSGRLQEFSEGAAILIPPDQYFFGEGRSADAAIWVLHIEEETQPAKVRHRVRVFPRRLIGSFGSSLLTEITSTWRARPRQQAYLKSLAHTLLAFLSVPENQTPTIRQKQEQLLPGMEGAPAPARVSGLAHRAGFCDSHYRALFRQTFGETPRTHLRSIKINKARDLLRETRMPIKDIATRVGYGDTVAFHRAFTALTGCTPARYRKSSTLAA